MAGTGSGSLVRKDNFLKETWTSPGTAEAGVSTSELVHEVVDRPPFLTGCQLEARNVDSLPSRSCLYDMAMASLRASDEGERERERGTQDRSHRLL